MGYSGYKKIYVGTDYPGADRVGFVSEHRYVQETQILHRQLKKGEVVHHCDRQRLNNRPENLWVFINKEAHQTYHAGGTPIQLPDGTYTAEFPKITKICEYCGKEFEPVRKNAKHCSKECAMLDSRKVKRPAKSELKNLLMEFPMTKIAQIYGITDNGVRRWCQMYKLPYRLKGIKAMKEREQAKSAEKAKLAENKTKQKESAQLKRQLEHLN